MLKDVGILGGAIVCFLLSMFLGGVLTPLLTSANADLAAAAAAAKTASYIGYAIGGLLLIVVALITRFAIGHWLLFVLFLTHAMVGAVELGTDGWIQNITGNILTSEQGKILFVFTSMLMFSLRFCADFIEKRLGFSPVAILLSCAILACVGLNLVSGIGAFGGALLALAIYGIGKTFFWPTMLAVTSDRFPRTGAVAISIMGGIGMMSAGLIGAPGLGYAKDRFSGEALQKSNPAVYETAKAQNPSRFLFFEPANGLDGSKLGAVQGKLTASRAELEKAGNKDPKAALATLAPEEKAILDSSISGDRKTLRADSFIPAAMAVIYLMILLYFKAIGGYKPVHIGEPEQAGEPARAV
jgi:hypothetical protein